MMAMTLEQIRDEVVRRGKVAVLRDYPEPEQSDKLRGSLAGFDRAAKLPLNYEQFEAEIDKLGTELREMRGRGEMAGYWERRCFQLELQYVFEVLKVAWKRYPLSARATMAYQEILTDVAPGSLLTKIKEGGR